MQSILFILFGRLLKRHKKTQFFVEKIARVSLNFFKLLNSQIILYFKKFELYISHISIFRVFD